MTIRKLARHGLRMFTEPHRLRAYFFYKTHPSYPLFTPTATEFLRKYLQPGVHLFEWGAGRSTPFFLRQGINVISVEHDPVWHQKISRYATSHLDLQLISEVPTYIAAIKRYPDNFFDVVVVDGREREACLLAAMPKVKPGGKLFLDDSQRERYHPAMAEVEQQGWATTHFPYGFNRTTMWTKPPHALTLLNSSTAAPSSK